MPFVVTDTQIFDVQVLLIVSAESGSKTGKVIVESRCIFVYVLFLTEVVASFLFDCLLEKAV